MTQDQSVNPLDQNIKPLYIHPAPKTSHDAQSYSIPSRISVTVCTITAVRTSIAIAGSSHKPSYTYPAAPPNTAPYTSAARQILGILAPQEEHLPRSIKYDNIGISSYTLSSLPQESHTDLLLCQYPPVFIPAAQEKDPNTAPTMAKKTTDILMFDRLLSPFMMAYGKEPKQGVAAP